MENAEKFFETYCDFVTKVTSNPSLKIEDLKKSLDDIQDKSSIDAPRLLTAALGLGSETGIDLQNQELQIPFLDPPLPNGFLAIYAKSHEKYHTRNFPSLVELYLQFSLAFPLKLYW